MKRESSFRIDCFALFSLALLIAALHHSALSGSWRWDDGMHLLHTTQYPWNSVFLDLEVLRSVSGNQFAPWNLFLYYVNSSLFGANVRLFYAHHLFSLWAAAAGLYVLLRQWLPAGRAWVTPALLLAGVPTFQMAQQLMVGHYLDGLLFACIGLVCHVRAINAREASHGIALGLSLAGALFYGLACLCKEIYVPWILMWLVLPTVLAASSTWSVIICAAPALLVALVYTLARVQLFGSAGGYFGGGASNWDAAYMVQSIASVPRVLFGDGARSVVAVALVLLGFFAGRCYSRAWGLVCASALLITLFPLVFLAGSNPPWALHARYLWAPWLLFCVAWAPPWHGIAQRMQWFACLLFAMLALLQAAHLRPADKQREALFDAHSRMALQPPRGVTHWIPSEFNSAGYLNFVTYGASEALRRMGHTTRAAPQILRVMPNSPSEQAAVQVWDERCSCFRSMAALTPETRQAAFMRVTSEKGLLLPGIHPLADAYKGPTPEMRIEGKQLYVSGSAVSEGSGHVLVLAGWASAKLISSRVVTQAASGNSEVKLMTYQILLESEDAVAAHKTRETLCVLMQSQTEPYTFVALDSAAPSAACRNLLTPWALRQDPINWSPNR